MQVSRYHRFLRVSVLVALFALVFDGGFIFPVTKQLSQNTYMYLGSVGSSMSAVVPPNEINTLTAQITEQQRNLDAREAALREREISARSYDTGGTDYSTYIISIILFILTVLMVLNYAMDWARIRKINTYEKSMG